MPFLNITNVTVNSYVRKTVDIFISDKMRDILTEFRSESVVADLLLNRRISKEYLVDKPINYISISDSDISKISYLSEDKLLKIENSEDKNHWTASIRYRSKPGVFVGKIFKNIDPKDIEKFSNLYKSYTQKKDFIFEVVNGDSIKKYYRDENYQSQSGTLGNSCMKYSRCQNWFDMYTNDPKISMLVMKLTKESSTIIGRALLYNLSEEDETSSGDTKIMDRIYTTQDEHQCFFKRWATDNGYVSKTHQNFKSTLQFDNNSITSEYKFGIYLIKNQSSRYPYLDTFKWLDIEKNILYNYIPEYFINDSSKFVNLSSSDGGKYDIDYMRFDFVSRDFEYPGNLIQYSDNLYTRSENCNFSEMLNRYILKSESEYNESVRDYLYTDISKVDQKLLQERRKFISERYGEQAKEKNKYSSVLEGMVDLRYFNNDRIYFSSRTQQAVEEISEMINISSPDSIINF